MDSRQKTIFAAVTVVVVAVVLFVLLKPGDAEDEPTAEPEAPVTAESEGTSDQKPASKPAEPAPPKVPTVVFRNGRPVGGILGIEVKKGEPIKFRVKSDIADEVHVHGFDITRDVPAGGSVSFSFPADITGIFEAEMERPGVQIAELQINP